jgi:hypothetical protein
MGVETPIPGRYLTKQEAYISAIYKKGINSLELRLLILLLNYIHQKQSDVPGRHGRFSLNQGLHVVRQVLSREEACPQGRLVHSILLLFDVLLQLPRPEQFDTSVYQWR